MTPEALLVKIQLLTDEKIVNLDGQVFRGKIIINFEHGKRTYIEKRETVK